MIQLERRLSWSICSNFGEDRLKIVDARDYRMHWLRCNTNVHAQTHTVTHTHTHTHGVTRVTDINWKLSLSKSMYMDWTDNYSLHHGNAKFPHMIWHELSTANVDRTGMSGKVVELTVTLVTVVEAAVVVLDTRCIALTTSAANKPTITPTSTWMLLT